MAASPNVAELCEVRLFIARAYICKWFLFIWGGGGGDAVLFNEWTIPPDE